MVAAEPQLHEDIAHVKDEGNTYFRAGDFLKAAGSYTKAIKASERDRPNASLLGRLLKPSFPSRF